MTFQARVRRFLSQHELRHSAETHALDLVSEVGEVVKALLAVTDYGALPPRTDVALEEELGDAFFALIALAESLDVDLEAALQAVLLKYEGRLAGKGHAGSGPA